MAVISITATPSDLELISGIPAFIGLETNIPSTIYYTLDGTEPDTYSQIYLREIETPTDKEQLELKALAISGFDIGYLDVIYIINQSQTYKYRRIEGYGDGFVVDAYDIANIFHDGYSSDEFGNIDVPARFSDYSEEELIPETEYSTHGPDGLGTGTIFHLSPLPETEREKVEEVSWTASSPNHQNVYFNPKSLYITIDGRDGYEDQSVRIINHPLDGTMNLLKYLDGKSLREPCPYISGGAVRTFYSADNRIAVRYYFDMNECRWVKSIQNFNPEEVPRNIGLRYAQGPFFVFKWIYNKRSSI